MIEKKLTCSQIKKAAILKAAMLEFQDKGFKHASMDDIAKQAEVSKRTVYNHFASKELLFNAIMAEMLTLFHSIECIPFSLEISVEIQLRQLVEQELSLFKSPGLLACTKVIISELLHSPHLIKGTIEEMNNWESPLLTWFTKACAAGVIKSQHPDIVVEQFIAVIKGFCFWPQLIQGAEFPDPQKQQLITDTVVEMIVRQYT
jgi:TetR/AcrR family transcriptional regulator of autoinduction and epiphytic fitness